MRSISFFIVFFFWLGSCKEREPTNEVFRYYPPLDLFEDGVVNKYYNHYIPSNPNKVTSTNIFYILLQKTSFNTFKLVEYNTGFQLTDYNEYTVLDYKLRVDSSYSVYQADTTYSKILSSISQDWTGETKPNSAFEMDYGKERYRFDNQQVLVRDSIILDRAAKIIESEGKIMDVSKDTVVVNMQTTRYYVKDFGYFGKQSTRENGKFVTELVEQMPISKFRRLANHGRKRVAYIDPNTTLDKPVDFELCGHELQIADYYNSDPDGRYADGKREMMNIIYDKLDRSKMHNETGYLTIRFVVNCKGEAGRFTTELSSLDFQEKDFDQETVNHLFGILYELKKWRPVVIRNEPRDAYFYITFKLKDGEITDILP